MRNLVFIAAASLCLAGCLEFDILVKVNRDGSGTVEQTVLMSKAIINEMEEMAKSFGSDEEKGKNSFNLIDKKKLVEEAKTMGKGVRFIQAKPITTKEQKGYVAYFSFKDINTLLIDQDPSGKTPILQESDAQSVKQPTKFLFTKGDPSTLIIHTSEKTFEPDTSSKDSTGSETAADDTSGIEMMMEMMKGFRISLAVQVNGTITETNATHVDGSKVTLMDVNFEKIMRDREKFKEISLRKPKTAEEVKHLLKDVPWMKLEIENEISIQFK
jgi:hypothetical protein